MLPAEKQKYGVSVVEFRADAQEIVMSDGTVIHYNKLMSTIPLDITLTKLGNLASASNGWK